MRLLGLILCFLTTGCNVFYKTVNIELPERYDGWILVVPVSDSMLSNVYKNEGRYVVSSEGIYYLPASVMEGVKRYKIYQKSEDLEPQMQYSGLAQDHIKGDDHSYIQFYLPRFRPEALRRVNTGGSSDHSLRNRSEKR